MFVIIGITFLTCNSIKSGPAYEAAEEEGSPRRRPLSELIAPIPRRSSHGSVNMSHAQILATIQGQIQIPPAALPLAQSPLIQRVRKSLPGAD